MPPQGWSVVPEAAGWTRVEEAPKGDTYTGPDTYDAGYYQSLKKQGADLARAGLNTLPGIGGLIGGALSTPETLGVGTIPGVALGAGVGRAARDLIGHATGLDAPSTPLQKAGGIAGETALTAGTMAILPGVVTAARSPVQTLREGAEQFGSAMPPAVRRLARLLPSIGKAEAGPIMARPAWQSWPEAPPVDLSRPVQAGRLTQEGIRERIDAVRAIGGLPAETQAQMPTVRGSLRMAPPPVAPVEPPTAMPESWKPFADQPARPPSPMQQPRVEIGAENVGRGAGLTKEQVRMQTEPIVGEAKGDASPILPETPLARIIDTLKSMPAGSAEREAYVARATSGKARGQVENIRRTLEHLGLIVPVAATAGSALRDAVRNRLGGATTSSGGVSQ